MIDTFTALGDSTRRDIIEILAARGQVSATDIYKKFDVSAPAISQHLKVLREANLVTVEKKAQQRLYQINPTSMHQMEDWIKKMTLQWNERFDRLEKLLATEKRKLVVHGK